MEGLIRLIVAYSQLDLKVLGLAPTNVLRHQTFKVIPHVTRSMQTPVVKDVPYKTHIQSHIPCIMRALFTLFEDYRETLWRLDLQYISFLKELA